MSHFTSFSLVIFCFSCVKLCLSFQVWFCMVMNTYSVIYLGLYISPESEYFCLLLYMDGTSIELFEPSQESYQRAKQCMFIECKMVGWACEGAHKVCVCGRLKRAWWMFVTLSVTLNNLEILLSDSLIYLG